MGEWVAGPGGSRAVSGMGGRKKFWGELIGGIGGQQPAS